MIVALEASSNALVYLAPSGSIVHANAAARRLTQTAGCEDVPAHLSELVGDPDLERLQSALRHGSASEGALTRAGKAKWCFRLWPMRDDDGNVAGAVLALEIPPETAVPPPGEHDRDERFLLARTNQLNVMFEVSPTGMVVVDSIGAILSLNARAERIFGYGRAELIGRPLDVILPNQAGDASFGLRKDGTRVPIEMSLHPFTTETGTFALASVLDVTDRLMAESRLRENEARFRTLFHESPIALCEQDFSAVKRFLDGLGCATPAELVAHLRSHPETVAEASALVRFVEINDATVSMYEAKNRKELLDNWPRIFGRGMLPIFMEELCYLVEGRGSTFGAHARTRTLQGRPNEIDFRLTVLPGAERDWSRLVASIFDMTQYREVERNLRAAIREKDVLLKEVHHRVKNNLQVISSLLNLQAGHIADVNSRAAFANSQGRVRSIALVHEKLYRSTDLAHVRFDEYVTTLADELLRAHGSNGSIRSIVEVTDVELSVDLAIPCGFIVNELMTNALKHAFQGRDGGTITVKAHRMSEGRLELEVSDDGNGIPESIDPRNTPSLGLDLVFTFAEQLEAEVTLERSRGTRFVFRFAAAT